MKLVVLLLLLPSFSFAFNKEEIRQTIRKNMKEIKGCYVEALKTSPDLEGKVVLKWSINDQGKATDVSVIEARSTLKDPSVTDCLIGKLKTWSFVAPEKGMTVVVEAYPFVFNKSK